MTVDPLFTRQQLQTDRENHFASHLLPGYINGPVHVIWHELKSLHSEATTYVCKTMLVVSA